MGEQSQQRDSESSGQASTSSRPQAQEEEVVSPLDVSEKGSDETEEPAGFGREAE